MRNASRLLFVSGQIPQEPDGQVPATFEAQCRQAWANILGTLSSAGMTVANLVKVTTYLGDRSCAAANRAIRRDILGEHRPALTVVVAEIFDPEWLIEIEAIAAA